MTKNSVFFVFIPNPVRGVRRAITTVAVLGLLLGSLALPAVPAVLKGAFKAAYAVRAGTERSLSCSPMNAC